MMLPFEVPVQSCIEGRIVLKPYTLIEGDWDLGIIVQIDLIDFKASITGTVLQPGQTTLATASGSLFAPLPVAGPDVRYYFAKNRLYVDGNLKGMYFFGYGNFVSTAGKVGVALGRHIAVVGGYELGSHLAIHGTNSRLDIRQTQRDPTGGLAFTFWLGFG